MDKKRRIIILILLITTLIILSLFYTYAIDVKMDKTTGTADLTFNINITDTNGKTITVPAGETKTLDFFLTNNNAGTIRYGLAYSGTKPNTVRIAQSSRSKNLVNSTIAANTTYQITLIIENKSDTSYTYTIAPVTGYVNGGELPVESGYTLITDIYSVLLPMNANDYIISLAGNCTSWESGFSGICQTNGHEYRYVGGEVDNYVLFNNDLYQIIGVFDDNSHGVTGQQLVKLISARPIGSYAWGVTNTSPTYTTYSKLDNNWETANANILLNEYFLNATDTSTTYKSCSDWTYYNSNNNYKTKDCSNIVGYGIQTTNLRNYIQPVTWYIKGFYTNDYTKSDFYNCERGQTTGDSTKDSMCNSGNSGAYSATITNTSIGLMYASDYLYASGFYASTNPIDASEQYYGQQNWLFNGFDEWTITPMPDSDYAYAYYVGIGKVDSYSTNLPFALRPTFYLKSTIKIKSGTGTFQDPYIIG